MKARRSTRDKLRPRDFQFSLGRMLVAMTLCAVLLGLDVLPTLGVAKGAILSMVVLLVLFSDWSLRHEGVVELALQTGNFRRAVEILSRVVEADPEDPDRYYRRACAHQAAGDLPAAFSDFTKAAQLDASHAAAWAGRAVIEQRRGNLQQSVDDATIAICLQPGNVDMLLIRGLAYLALGRFEDALKDNTQAIQIDEHGATAYCFRGLVHLTARSFDQALRDFHEARRLGATGHVLPVGESFALFKLGRYGEAVAAVEACLAEDPQCADALGAQAWMLATCPDDSFRDGQRALEAAQAAEQRSDAASFGWERSLAAAYAELGQFDRAVEHAQNVLDLAPPVEQAMAQERLTNYKVGRPYRDFGTDGRSS